MTKPIKAWCVFDGDGDMIVLSNDVKLEWTPDNPPSRVCPECGHEFRWEPTPGGGHIVTNGCPSCNGTGKESPMSKIQRYRAKIHEHNYEPQPATMCLDEDVSKLEALLAERDAEIERLNEIIEAGFENLSKCKAENAQKDAEIERLSMDLHLKSSEVQQMKNKIDYVSVTDAENRVLKADNAELKKRVEELDKERTCGSCGEPLITSRDCPTCTRLWES
jgi:hypothetical protein